MFCFLLSLLSDLFVSPFLFLFLLSGKVWLYVTVSEQSPSLISKHSLSLKDFRCSQIRPSVKNHPIFCQFQNLYHVIPVFSIPQIKLPLKSANECNCEILQITNTLTLKSVCTLKCTYISGSTQSDVSLFCCCNSLCHHWSIWPPCDSSLLIHLKDLSVCCCLTRNKTAVIVHISWYKASAQTGFSWLIGGPNVHCRFYSAWNAKAS